MKCFIDKTEKAYILLQNFSNYWFQNCHRVQFKLSHTSSGKITLLSTERTGNMVIYTAYLPPRHCEPAG
jgi:hypothetical protein